MSNDDDFSTDVGSDTEADGAPEEDALEPFREVPVGTNDPNIVGDVGPFDTPPGTDGDHDGAFGDETDE